MLVTFWTFERYEVMPVLEAKGQSSDKLSEKYLVQKAVKLILQSKKYKGVPLVGPPQIFNSQKMNVEVSFSLVFPTNDDLYMFIKEITPHK